MAQAVLGGFTVQEHLAPGFVMAHFRLSMLILIAAVALAWRSAHEPGARPRHSDRWSVWSVRALAPLGALTIFAGTAATAAGPHSGGFTGQHIHRLHFKGADTLTWVVHRHATIAALFGVAVIAVWLLRRASGVPSAMLEPLTVLGVLLAAQGLVGSVQYELHLPADMVWVHVTLATLTWLAVLWAVAAAGRLAPRRTAEVHEFERRSRPRRRGRSAGPRACAWRAGRGSRGGDPRRWRRDAEEPPQSGVATGYAQGREPGPIGEVNRRARYDRLKQCN